MSKRGEVLALGESSTICRAVAAGIAGIGSHGQLGRFPQLRAGEREEGHGESPGRALESGGGEVWRVELAESGYDSRTNPAGSLCAQRCR